jgi:hypothetical protein
MPNTTLRTFRIDKTYPQSYHLKLPKVIETIFYKLTTHDKDTEKKYFLIQYANNYRHVEKETTKIEYQQVYELEKEGYYFYSIDCKSVKNIITEQ